MSDDPTTRNRGSVAFDPDALNEALLDWGADLRDDAGQRVVPTIALLKHEVADLLFGDAGDPARRPDPKFVNRAFRGERISRQRALVLARALHADLADLTAVPLPPDPTGADPTPRELADELAAEDWADFLAAFSDRGELELETRDQPVREREVLVLRPGATSALAPARIQVPLGCDHRLRFRPALRPDEHVVLLQGTAGGWYAMLPSAHWPELPIPAGADGLDCLPGPGARDWMGMVDAGRVCFLLVVSSEPLLDAPRAWTAAGGSLPYALRLQLARRVLDLPAPKVRLARLDVDVTETGCAA